MDEGAFPPERRSCPPPPLLPPLLQLLTRRPREMPEGLRSCPATPSKVTIDELERWCRASSEGENPSSSDDEERLPERARPFSIALRRGESRARAWVGARVSNGGPSSQKQRS